MILKEYLKFFGITNKDFAKRIGISPVSLSRYMSGERLPEKEIILKIFTATNGAVNPNDFYFKSTNDNNKENFDSNSINETVINIRNGSKKTLAKTITLIESKLKEHQELVKKIFENFKTNNKTIRIGITGVPGVGKSTFIESLGLKLIQKGMQVAVLAIDPSSKQTGGSILGDKTRMEKLSVHPRAFIRPSPSDGHLGGVAKKTYESMLCLEEAGYNVIFIETMGVGQAETAVYDMVDIFLVLLLPSGGDELQGIKKGIIELADLIIVNKADNDLEKTAEITQREYKTALHISGKQKIGYEIEVLMCSSIKSRGFDEIWDFVQNFIKKQKENKTFFINREGQLKKWMRNSIHQTVSEFINSDLSKNGFLKQIQMKVNDKKLSVFKATQLISNFLLKK